MKVYLLVLLLSLVSSNTYYARLKYCKCTKEHSSQYFCESYECLEQYTGKKAGDCFDSEAKVIVGHNKTKKIKDLEIGESIYQMDSNGRLEQDEFIGFLHLNTSKSIRLRVLKDNESKVLLELSDYHVVYGKVGGQLGYYFGLELGQGDMIIHNGQYVYSILSIILLILFIVRNSTGIATPLTRSGMIEVDGGLASNYAYYKEHELANKAFWIYKMLPWKSQTILDYYVSGLEIIRSMI